MSEDAPQQEAAPETASEPSDFDKLKALAEKVSVDGPKGLEGNKQAARRARSALNDLKKLCTPLRIRIQEAVKPKKG